MKIIIPEVELSDQVEKLRIQLWEFEKSVADFRIRIPGKESISTEMWAYYNDATKKIFGLEEHGEIIGFIYGNIEKSSDYIEEYDKTGHIGWIYIEEAFRGKWWWKMLIDSMLNWFQSEDIHLIQLGVLTTNLEALEVYKKYGFQSYYTKMKVIM